MKLVSKIMSIVYTYTTQNTSIRSDRAHVAGIHCIYTARPLPSVSYTQLRWRAREDSKKKRRQTGIHYWWCEGNTTTFEITGIAYRSSTNKINVYLEGNIEESFHAFVPNEDEIYL